MEFIKLIHCRAQRYLRIMSAVVRVKLYVTQLFITTGKLCSIITVETGQLTLRVL